MALPCEQSLLPDLSRKIEGDAGYSGIYGTKQQINLVSLWGDSFTNVGYNIGQAETLLGCINRYHCSFWTGLLLTPTCYFKTRRDYLIIKLVFVYPWYENFLPLQWNKIIPLPFFSYINNIISFFCSMKKASLLSSFVCFWENKGIMLQTLRRKQKYQVTNVGVEKIKLSRLLVQRNNEFKMNKIQRKHHSKI